MEKVEIVGYGRTQADAEAAAKAGLSEYRRQQAEDEVNARGFLFILLVLAGYAHLMVRIIIEGFRRPIAALVLAGASALVLYYVFSGVFRSNDGFKMFTYVVLFAFLCGYAGFRIPHLASRLEHFGASTMIALISRAPAIGRPLYVAAQFTPTLIIAALVAVGLAVRLPDWVFDYASLALLFAAILIAQQVGVLIYNRTKHPLSELVSFTGQLR